MSLNPSGAQYQIAGGRHGAVVTEVGATLRSLTFEGRELLWTFSADGKPAHSQGKQLLPWPNRIADGRYRFGGVTQQLAVTEIDRNTALHGLNNGIAWDLVSHDEGSVVQRHTFYPQNGWPGLLTVTITHSISDEGLVVEVFAVNEGAFPAPYGYGVHPYFEFGHLEDVTLHLPFASELDVDPDRLLPIAVRDISTSMDFREARRIGDTEFDTAFCGPTESDWAVELRAESHGVVVWADASMPWIQVYTTRPDRHAIAIEPMTCGPDAFNEGPTHDGMIVLAPGESTRARWGAKGL